MFTVPALMFAAAEVDTLAPAPTVSTPLAVRSPPPPKVIEPPLSVTSVELSPPAPAKLIEPAVTLTGPPAVRPPPAAKETDPPFTVRPPPSATAPPPARATVAPLPPVTTPPIVNAFAPFSCNAPPVTSTFPLTSVPAPLRATPFSVNVPVPLLLRLAAVNGIEIAAGAFAVTVMPLVTVRTRVLPAPGRLTVAPAEMVSEFASAFPPLFTETVTANGMVRSSAAVGMPAGFQLAALFQAPLAAAAQVRGTAWATGAISIAVSNVTGIQRLTASPFSPADLRELAISSPRDATHDGPAPLPGSETAGRRGTERRGAGSTTADPASGPAAHRGAAPATALPGAPESAGSRAATREEWPARTTPAPSTPEAPPRGARRATGTRARPAPGLPRRDAGSPSDSHSSGSRP